MERPYKAVDITRHVWIPWDGHTRGDMLTTMETTRGYAYDDGRSMERKLQIWERKYMQHAMRISS